MTAEVTASIEVAPSELGTSLCAVRLCAPAVQEQMQLSFSKLGQLTPVQVWRSSAGGDLENQIFDGGEAPPGNVKRGLDGGLRGAEDFADAVFLPSATTS